jgi:hypothetical protein
VNSSQLEADISAVIATLAKDPIKEIRDIADLVAVLSPPKRATKKVLPSSLPYLEPLPKQMKAVLSPPRTATCSAFLSSRTSPHRQSSVRAPVSPPTPSFISDLPEPAAMPFIDLFPPASVDMAIAFRSQIVELARTKGGLPDVETSVILTSIVRAIGYLPGKENWEEDLAVLFEAFPQAMQTDPISLLRGFAFEPWAIDLLAKYMSIQEVAESFLFTTPGSVRIAYDFFNQVFHMKSIQIEVTPKVRDTLQTLFRRYRPAQANPLILKALKSEGQLGEFMKLLAALSEELSGISETPDSVPRPSTLLGAIVAAIEENPDFAEKLRDDFNRTLPSLLKSGLQGQRQAVLALVIAAAPLLKTVSFEASIHALITILPSAPELETMALQSLIATLSDVRVLGQLIRFLESGKDTKLFSFKPLTEYFTIAAPQKMLPVRKIIFAKLCPFFDHANPEVRKCIISIFADFATKIPREFESQLKKLTQGQRRLVELAAAKRHAHKNLPE